MGRNEWSRRQIIEECKPLSILDSTLKSKFENYRDDLVIDIKLSRDGKQVNHQIVYFARTTIFGKPWFRFWLMCPRCRRRFLSLYLPPNKDFYACRKCHDLTYRSQKKRNGFQERWLMQFTGSRKQAWQLLDSFHGR